MVVHGSADRMISFPHGKALLEGLRSGARNARDVEEHLIDGQGHVIPIEMRKEFNGWVKRLIKRTRAMK